MSFESSFHTLRMKTLTYVPLSLWTYLTLIQDHLNFWMCLN